MNQLIAHRRLHYGWIVVAVAGAAVLIGTSRSSVAGALAVAAGAASRSIKRNQRPVLLAAT